MEKINFNNPDFDNYLEKIGFVRQDDNDSESTIFKNGGITIDLSKGMTANNLSKIIHSAIKEGESNKVKQFRGLLEVQ